MNNSKEDALLGKNRNKIDHSFFTVLWIRIHIGSEFRNFVDPDPHM